MSLQSLLIRLATSLLVVLSLASCKQDSAPGSAPANVQAFNGDRAITVTWDQEPGKTYYLFYAQTSSATRDNILNQPESRVFSAISSPFTFIVASNDKPYTLLMNATEGTSKAGPSSAPITVTPRVAGNAWVQGDSSLAMDDIRSVSFGLNRFVLTGDKGGLFTLEGPQQASPTRSAVESVSFASANAAGEAVLATQFITSPQTRFLALGSAGSAFLSANGVDGWTRVATGVTTALNGMTHSGSTTIAVGDGGVILSSSDGGNTWTRRGLNVTSENLLAVTFALGRFIAVGRNGTILVATSPDAWSVLPSGVTESLNAISGNGVEAVIVGDNGRILQINNATTPVVVNQTSNVSANLRAVTLSSQFVISGDNSTFLRGASFDANTNQYTWTVVTPTRADGTTAADSVNQNALIYAYNRLLSFGSAGSYFVSPQP